MLKKMVIGGALIIFTFIVLIDSGAIYCRKSVEERRGIEYDVSHFEWHPEKIPEYFKNIWENIKKWSNSTQKKLDLSKS